jgi:hypothetical protein
LSFPDAVRAIKFVSYALRDWPYLEVGQSVDTGTRTRLAHYIERRLAACTLEHKIRFSHNLYPLETSNFLEKPASLSSNSRNILAPEFVQRDLQNLLEMPSRFGARVARQ